MNKFILSCGSKKRSARTEAWNLYTGTFFKLQLDWAKRNGAKKNDIFILSAKYGLIRSNEIIEPYNIRMGSKESICFDVVKKQAEELCIKGTIWSSAASDYKKVLNKIFPDIIFPFNKCKGLGYIYQGLKKHNVRNHKKI